MAYYSHVPMEDILYELPFSLPTNLPNDALLSPNLVDTLATAELYMRNKEYLTAVAIYTVALRRIGVPASLALVASLVCNRAECLLYMNYVQDVFRNCNLVMDLLGGVNEHAAFLLMRAHEVQGEIQEAYCYAITYQSLDPELKRDKNAVKRVREKIVLSFGQGPHEISWTINNLMYHGIKLLEDNQANLALSYFTEILAFFPSLQEALEYRARCFLIKGDLQRANKDCNGALQVSERRSGNAFAIKVEIMIQAGELNQALDVATEWRRIEPMNRNIDEMVRKIEEKMHEEEARISLNRTQSDRGFGHADQERHSISQESAVPGTTTQERRKRKKKRRKARSRRKQGDDMEDDSDASSVCSISTCPGDLDLTKGAATSKLPNFDDTWSVQVSRRRSRSSQTKRKPVTSITSPQVHSSDSPGNKNKGKEQDVFRTRPSDVRGAYRLCIYHRSGDTCFQGEKCPFAHSEVERKAWEQQRKEASRNHQRKREGKPDDKSGTKPLSLKEWCQAFQGTCRAPLRKPKGRQYKICPRWTEGFCKLKDKCIFAHGEKERKEWNEHVKRMEEKMRKGKVEENTVQQATDSKEESKVVEVLQPLSNENPAPTYKNESLVRSLPGVTFTSEPRDLHVSLQVPLNKEGVNNYSWTIKLCYHSKTSGHLQHITLLPQHHKCFSLSAVRFKCSLETMAASGQTQSVVKRDFEKLNEFLFVPSYLRELHGSYEVDISVLFSSSVFGNFSQLVVFDFGQRFHLALDLSIDVGSQEFLSAFAEEKSKLTADWPLWDNESMKIIAFNPKSPPVFDNEDLLAKYKLPHRPEDIVPSPIITGSGGLSKENYKDVMHQLLFVEESYIRKQVARFNERSVKLHVSNCIVKTREALWASDGSLYGYFRISHAITPDDAPGRLLRRNVFGSGGSVLLAKSDCSKAIAYEALVDSVEDNRVILKLSAQCCEDLSLFNNSEIAVDVQFQINRLSLCEMHDNIDRLGPEHIRILFPEFSNNVSGSEDEVTLRWILDQTLNEQQKCVIKTVAKPSIKAPPLVVFGPFGTGKTFTLSQAVRQIVLDSNNRVLICTHSNSAADLHVKLLDDYLRNQHGLQACRPLRIYTPLRKMSSVSDEVKRYCLTRDQGEPTEAFRLPTLEDVLSNRVIITTLSMSRALFDMNLHRGFFSHILIDEAAQALETEILAPITLAGYSTKVIFTGDHMQMSPDVFSDQAKKWGLQTSLPQRLFHDYKARQKKEETNTTLIFLTKNYRSHEQVLQFSSEMFYGGKLLSDAKQPLHPSLGPLLFYSALGREELDDSSSSYRNLAEVNEVVRRVKELVDNWPEQWGPRKLEEIAVLTSYRYQVQTIRDGLRKNGIGAVDVETVENVQGKQFRAVFISTVRTYHTRMLGTGEPSAYLHFLSDPRLLNTALTRAQSLIAVIGDPFSLRTVGECQVLWEEFINRCSRGGMLFGIEHKELEEAISKSGLNINASEFVPGPFARSQCNDPKPYNHVSLEKDKSGLVVEASQAVPILSAEVCLEGGERCTTLSAKKCYSNATESTDTFVDTCHGDSKGDDCQVVEAGKNTDPSESNSDYGAEDEDNEPCANKDHEPLTNEEVIDADYELAGRAAGEAVPPVEMDDIILALKEICEEQIQREQKNEGKRNTQELKYLCSVPKESQNSQGRKVVHEDLEMIRRKGVTQVQLVNLPNEYSERANRLLSQPRDRAPGHLDIEHLDRLLREAPQEYLLCTLRISYEGSPRCYGYTQDTERKDIQIEGSIRQCFDGDIAVVKLQNECENEMKGTQDTSVLGGKIVGVRHRVVRPRGQQFVCRISKRNPTIMIPINKSFPLIANARDESCKGVPIYNRIPDQSLTKPVRARMLPMREALSGNHLFVVQYLQWRPEFPTPLGIVTKTISRGNDLPCSLKVLDTEYGLKKTFPKEVDANSEIISDSWDDILSHEKEKRALVENAFTIDPPRSKALDDALSVEKREGGKYRVGIHIADVSYFVESGSAFDKEARKRGTSYFRGHGEEGSLMLPEHLSHDICSLLPNKERLAVSVYLDMDKHGGIVETMPFSRTIVKSRCQLTYNEVQKMIVKKATDGTRIPYAVFRSVRLLSRLAQNMRKVRLQEGSFNHFDHEDRKEDFEAHELVEEFMILANRTVAKYLVEGNVRFAPLRIQLPPKKHKIEVWNENVGRCAKFSLSLRRHLLEEEIKQSTEFAESFRVGISTWNAIIEAVCLARHSGEYRELRLLICNDNIYPQLAVAQAHLRRIMRKAEYVFAGEVPLDRMVHWSLNVSKYTHFTSPIRRYVDIEVHRLLLQHAELEEGRAPIDISELCRQCSLLEDQSAKFEKACRTVKFASKLKERSEAFSAFVDGIRTDYIQVQLPVEACCVPHKQKRIQIGHLGPTKQPHFDEALESLTLRWAFRVYDLSGTVRSKRKFDAYTRLLEESNARTDLSSENECDTTAFFKIPSELWLEVLDAIQTEDNRFLLRCLEKVDSSKKKEISSSERALQQTKEEEENEEERDAENEQGDNNDNNNDYVNDDDDRGDDDGDDYEDEDDNEEEEKYEDDDDKEKEEQDNYYDDDSDDDTEEEEEDANVMTKMMTLRQCDSLNIQLSVNSREEVLSPAVQLLTLSPELNICLEHHRYDRKCFALSAQHKASRKYRNIDAYINAWKALLDMEAATVAVRDDDAFRLLNLDVEWKEHFNAIEDVTSDFQSKTISCKTRDIKIPAGEKTVIGAFELGSCEEMLSVGDFVCARIPYKFSRPANNVLSGTRELFSVAADSQGENQWKENEEDADETMSESSDDYETASEGEEDKEETFSEKTQQFVADLEIKRRRKKAWWVGHCVVTREIKQKREPARFTLQLFQCSSRIPSEVFNGGHVSCNLEIIRQTVAHKRMIETLINLKKALPTPLAEICLGGELEDHRVRLPEDDLSIAKHHDGSELRELNIQQLQAVRLALRRPFILIQGPPGTGKTLTGVHIAYWFAQMNRDLAPSEARDAPPQVLYCGPSNKSVDVVAEYLLKIPGLKILRVYGSFTEQAEYPIPNSIKPIRKTQNKQDLKVPKNLEKVALHFVIRDTEKSPYYARKLKELEVYFALQRKTKLEVEPSKVTAYKKLIADAEQHALQNEGVQIILCTCTTAGSKRIVTWCDNIIQCIVDECGMCTEPETLVPIACCKASQVVLIGDHKQLQPVVMNTEASFLGLKTSLFERYSERAFMLLEQYRMHTEICEFPSNQFYDGKLKTPDSVARGENMIKKSKEYLGFWPSFEQRKAYVPLVFCDVIGEEEELVVATEEGGQKSKSNIKEKDKVVEVAKKLVNSCGVNRENIVILSPYRAQCQKIRQDIRDQGLQGIPVTSITKSQGSEWDFVIISLVRSLPESKIDPAPTRYWLRENLGFVTDEHQINVALTRAKRGLCIVGNKKLLRVYELWDQLIRHYESKFCLVDDTWPRN